jgi:hypothetical protein
MVVSTPMIREWPDWKSGLMMPLSPVPVFIFPQATARIQRQVAAAQLTPMLHWRSVAMGAVTAAIAAVDMVGLAGATTTTSATDRGTTRVGVVGLIMIIRRTAAIDAQAQLSVLRRRTDPLPWINKCETYFRGMRTMVEEKGWIASLHLDGMAAEWYYALERNHDILSWVRFTEFVNMRFGPPLGSNGLVELKELHCMDTVEEYQRQFSVLLCHCDDLSPSQQVNMFTSGLGEPLRTDIELQAPTNLQSAMSLARAYE